MFTAAKPVHYCGKEVQEYIWLNGDQLAQWPLFVRSNSIVPTGPVMQYIGQQTINPLTLTCYMADGGQAWAM